MGFKTIKIMIINTSEKNLWEKRPGLFVQWWSFVQYFMRRGYLAYLGIFAWDNWNTSVLMIIMINTIKYFLVIIVNGRVFNSVLIKTTGWFVLKAPFKLWCTFIRTIIIAAKFLGLFIQNIATKNNACWLLTFTLPFLILWNNDSTSAQKVRICIFID